MSGRAANDDVVRFTDVCCPFCGLLCDDLEIEQRGGLVSVCAPACARATRGFAQATADTGSVEVVARIDGRAATLDEAIAVAADHLRAASRPLVGGLASDVAGMRAAVSLAERCGGVIDHAAGAVMRRNLRVMQESGWMATTLSEVRTRADLVLVVGADVLELFPRFAERVLRPAPSEVEGDDTARHCVLLGPCAANGVPAALEGVATTLLPTALDGVGEVAGVLRALLRGAPLQATQVHGLDIAVLRDLAARLAAAGYSAVVWSAGDLDFPHADLAVEQLVALVRELNVTTRGGVLPLAGSNGDLTAAQVCTWQSGFPLQVGFERGAPRHDPLLNGGQRLLADGEVDLLLWLACHTADLPAPPHAGDTVVIGHPRLAPADGARVYIPAGVPGVDHGGHLFRTDSVVSLPLRALREPAWPAAADILRRIERALPGDAA